MIQQHCPLILAADRSPCRRHCVSWELGLPSYARHVSPPPPRIREGILMVQLASFKPRFRAHCSAESLKILL